jgi:carotenoid cleavage dioxygenase
MDTLERARIPVEAEQSSNPFLSGNYAPVDVETTAFDLKTRGEIPRELEGRLVRIGPNPLGPVDPAAYHWFTGAGMVHGLRLRDGRAEWYRNRAVVSDGVAPRLGRPPLPGPRNGFGDNTANTNVLDMGGRTYALVEGGALPVELTYTLESVARSDLGGTLRHGFAAHPKLDPQSGELHVLTYQPGLEALSYLRVDRAGRAHAVADIPAPHFPMVHDVAFTASRLLILDLPVTFDLAAFATGMPFIWNPARTPRVGLLPLDGDLDQLQWFEAPSCYVFHIMNAFDDGEGVTADVIRHHRVFEKNRHGPGEGQAPVLARWVFDRTSGRIKETILGEEGCEFPRLNDGLAGRPYRYGYTAAAGPRANGSLYKHDLMTNRIEVHDFGHGRSAMEPVFVPRQDGSDEDHGWIMTYVYDAARNASDVVILDAQGFDQDPVAVINLPVRVPYGFHGNWIADPKA